MSTSLAALAQWVDTVARLTRPDRIHWCDGSDAEIADLRRVMIDSGELIALDPDSHPDCFLHRSHPDDVARVEHLTYVCTRDPEDAGANNNWLAPDVARARMTALFDGCMRGRTLYVVPYCMGPIDSPMARCGVELTDSPYVVANMRIMTRMGRPALDRIEREGREAIARGEPGDGFVKGLHSIGELDPERRFIMHFPEDASIQSYGSGYGGNALLGKKCHALRIAGWQARQEGWLAEHMLIVGIESPDGRIDYIAAAFPSACGKTNLAMLIPPERYRRAGWKVWTVGDDICWMRPGADGRLWAINPESGFFGVAPGTGPDTNPNALAMLDRDAIFTNTAITADNRPWWEGLRQGQPAVDWRGRPHDPANGPAAHPNARFSVSARRCPSWTPHAEDAQGVPISAIVFGGRRPGLVPLVFEARDWQHGVLVGASMASETTAAAAGAVGVVRRDPMAMKPFCGYNVADYFGHWLSFDRSDLRLPRIFHVNWFRKGADGRFLWPGFGDNLRVLEWILGRVRGEADAVDTPIGRLPPASALNLEGLDLAPETLAALLAVDRQGWHAEMLAVRDYLDSLGPRLPTRLRRACEAVIERLQAAASDRASAPV